MKEKAQGDVDSPCAIHFNAASIYLMNSAASLEVANNILAQLGGHRFVVMTGATQVYGSADALQFALPARSAKGIAKVRIVLDPSDTYTVTFYKKTRDRFAPFAAVAELGMVYADQLREIFEAHTGLYTSL